MADKKIRVLVLYGGRSGEHEVSLRSGASVVKNLDKSKFEVIPVGIDKEGLWHLVNPKLLENKIMDVLPLPSDSPRGILPPRSDSKQVEIINLESQAKISGVDVVFPVLHGPLCEDGSIQGLCETAGVAYVGSGVLGSAVGMDKDVAKRLVAHAGLPYVPYLCYREAEWLRDQEKIRELAIVKLGLPLFVKPANMGSSVGVTKVNRAEDLAAAMQEAFQYDRKVLIEKAVNAREIEVSVLESLERNQPPMASIAGEIVPTHDFYSYEAKYLDENGATLHIPAALAPEQMREIRELSSRIFEVLELEGMARVDYFLERNTGKFYFNEVNTIPGFTTISMYPKLWEASGIGYSELLTHLIQLALNRHKEKLSLSRSFLPE